MGMDALGRQQRIQYSLLCFLGGQPSGYVASRRVFCYTADMNSSRISKRSILLAVFLWALLSVPAIAATIGHGETYALSGTTPTEGNVYLAAGTAIVSGPVIGDAVIGAGSATVSGFVSGDLLIAGGTVDVLGRVADDARIVGGKLTVADTVGGDFVGVGGVITLLPQSKVLKDSIIAGGQVSMLGSVAHNAYLAGGSIFIDGNISGSVRTYSAGKITLGPHAVIGGDFNYRSAQPAEISPTARITGTVHYEYLPPLVSARDVRGFFTGLLGIAFAVRLLILVAASLFFVLVFRRGSGGLIQLAVGDFWKMSLVGLVVFVTVPVASLILALTVFGSVVAFVMMLVWMILLVVAQIYAGVVFAYVCRTHLLHKEIPTLVSWNIAVLGVLLLSVLWLVPYAGLLACFLFFLSALGAISHLAYRTFLLSR